MTHYIFEKIVFKEIKLNQKENIYFIFDKDENIKEVEASSVLEAMSKSKIKDPVMIKNKTSMMSNSVILNEKLL